MEDDLDVLREKPTRRSLALLASSDALPRALNTLEPRIRVHKQLDDLLVSRLLMAPLCTPAVSGGDMRSEEFVEHHHPEVAALYRRMVSAAAEKLLLGGAKMDIAHPVSYFVAVVAKMQEPGCVPCSAESYFASARREVAMQRDRVQLAAIDRIENLRQLSARAAVSPSPGRASARESLYDAFERVFSDESQARFNAQMQRHGQSRAAAAAIARSDNEIEADCLVPPDTSEEVSMGAPEWALVAPTMLARPPLPIVSDDAPPLKLIPSLQQIDEYWDGVSAAVPQPVRLRLKRSALPSPPSSPHRTLPTQPPGNRIAVDDVWGTTEASRLAFLEDSDDDLAPPAAAAPAAVREAVEGLVDCVPSGRFAIDKASGKIRLSVPRRLAGQTRRALGTSGTSPEIPGARVVQEASLRASPASRGETPDTSAAHYTVESALAEVPHHVRMAAYVGLRAKGLVP